MSFIVCKNLPWHVEDSRHKDYIYVTDNRGITLLRIHGNSAWARKLAELVVATPDLLIASSDLIEDVKLRHPGEDLYCPFMQFLDEAVVQATGGAS